jgi:magnesium chelatase family protein
LFLDELAEFPAQRARGAPPAARGRRDLDRACGREDRVPGTLQLVATMNLCPCGARGEPGAECSCSAARLAAYRDKLSRAQLDRFDMVVTVPAARARELEGAPGRLTEAVRERVACARELALAAVAPHEGGKTSSLSRAPSSACLSRPEDGRASAGGADGRAARRRTAVETEHVAEALSYRSPSGAGAP